MQMTRILLALGFALTGWLGRADRAGADEGPADLQVELVFLPLTGSDRVLAIDVTNVGEGWAEATTLKVETVSPGAPQVRTFQVRSLATNQRERLTYTLATDCNGHVIRAEVPPTKSVRGQSEQNLTNNRVQQQVCPAPSVPSSGGVGVETGRTTGPIQAPPAGIEVKRLPVPVGVTLAPMKVQTLVAHARAGACPDPMPSFPRLLVGWVQYANDCGSMHQSAVLFDLDWLPIGGVSQALLTFDESPVTWIDDHGNPTVAKHSCAVRLGLATFDWGFQTVRSRTIPAEIVQSNIPDGSREWTVTSEINELLKGGRANFGFVLNGQFDDLNATQTSACLSRVDNLALSVVYWE